MERLTAYNSGNHKNVAYYPVCFEYPCNGFGCKIDGCKLDYEICQRLAAYEDTGLEPDDIKELCTDDVAEAAKMFRKMIESGEINHLQDLLQAEKDGLITPCKRGDVVYCIRHNPRTGYRVKSLTVCTVTVWGPGHFTIFTTKEDTLGKTVFLTREEAEAALAGKGGDLYENRAD